MEEAISERWQNTIELQLKEFERVGIRGVVVACSAGLDSTVLFWILHNKIRHIPSLRLELCHVNYQLRGSASDDAQQFVEQLGRDTGTKVHVHRINPVGRTVRNVQVWARNERYQIFEKFRNQRLAVALGHHHDDLAENILMRVGQGCGPKSLAGMTLWNSPYWRPLLGTSKQELARWAEGNNLQHLEDGSNAKLIYSRNVIRHKVIPEIQKLYPSFSRNLVRLAQQVTTQFDDIADGCSNLASLLKKGKSVSKVDLLEMDKNMAFEVISDALHDFKPRLNYQIIEQCHCALFAKRKRVQIAPNYFWTVANGRVAILLGEKSKPRQQQHRASLQIPRPTTWVPGEAETKWLQPITTKQ